MENKDEEVVVTEHNQEKILETQVNNEKVDLNEELNVALDIQNNTSDIIEISDDGHVVEDKTKKKIKIKKSLKIFLITLLFVVVLCSVIFIVHSHYKKLNHITIENHKVYQYFSGIRFDFDGKFSMTRDGDITKFEVDGNKVDCGSTPIYIVGDDNEMIIPVDMVFVIPREKTKNYKLPFFSRIVVDESEDGSNAFLKLKEEKKFLENSFLYDGKDTYVFLYEAKINIDGNSYVVSPLSYITVNYQGEINFYDKASDKFIIIESHTDDVVATLEGYSINLSTDMVMYGNNFKLLIKNATHLNSYINK